MKIYYDKKHDVAYIRFSAKKPSGAVEIQEGVVLDTTTRGDIVGLEIFRASRRIPLKSLTVLEREKRDAAA